MSKEALHARVDNDFSLHTPTPEAGALLDIIREATSALAHCYIELCPESRQLSIALTDLESAQRSAVAAIVCNQDALVNPLNPTPLVMP